MLLAVRMLFFFAPALQQNTPPPDCPVNITQNVWDPKFTPGQHWSYHHRVEDKNSTLVISKIDYVPEIGDVVHFKVDNVIYTYPHKDQFGKVVIEFTRVPEVFLSIQRDSLETSVDQLLGAVDILDVPKNYYRKWQISCKAITTTNTVAEALNDLNFKYSADRDKQEAEKQKRQQQHNQQNPH